MSTDHPNAQDPDGAVTPSMRFVLQRHADGLYGCAESSEACSQCLELAHDATPADWIRQWFNRAMPGDLPRIIFAIETAAINQRPLHVQWSQHVPGQGSQQLQLRSGPPEKLADGSQRWRCLVLPIFKYSPEKT